MSPEEKEYVENNVEYGGIVAPKDLFQKRLEICASCPKKTSTFGVDRCGECGCIINLKARLLVHVDFLQMKKVKTQCPLKKW